MTAPRPHTSDDDLAFWLKNKGEFSEQPWLNFLLELRDCRAANAEALELIEAAWFQWAYVINGFDCFDLDAPRFVCLSTLEDICDLLVAKGRLVKYDKRPEMDWWVRAAREAAPPREETAK